MWNKSDWIKARGYYDNPGTILRPTFAEINNTLSGISSGVSATVLNLLSGLSAQASQLNSISFPTSAAYAISAGYAVSASTAVSATHAAAASYSISSDYSLSGAYAVSATTAQYAASAGTLSGVSATAGQLNAATSFPASAAFAVSAGTALKALSATYSDSALYAVSVSYSLSGAYAVSASTAANATTAVTAAAATTSINSVSALYAISAGTAVRATTSDSTYSATYAVSSTYAVSASTAAQATTAVAASTSLKAISATYAASALYAGSALSAATASYAVSAATAGYAVSAGYSTSGVYAVSSNSAVWAASATTAASATHAATASYSNLSDYSLSAAYAVSATTAQGSLSASYAISAGTAANATTAVTAQAATTSVNSVSSLYAISAGTAAQSTTAVKAAALQSGITVNLATSYCTGTFSVSGNLTVGGYVSGTAQYALSAAYSISASTAAQATTSIAAATSLKAVSATYASTALYAGSATTASYAVSCATAGYAVNAGYSTSGVYAVSASTAANATTAVTAQGATTAINSVSALYAVSAGFAASANVGYTASAGYAVSAGTVGLLSGLLTNASADCVTAINELHTDSTRDRGVPWYINEWYGANTKLVAMFQSDETWTSGVGTQSNDAVNVKLGSQSLKILENDNTAGVLFSDRNSISLNLATFNDGSASSTSDYIYVVFYISDVTKIDTSGGKGIRLLFSQATSPDGNNVLGTITSGLVTGWNYVKIAKSDFAVNGTGAWSGIQSLRVYWYSLANAINAYVSFQLVQLIRKDPISAIPNPFQRCINSIWTRDFTINSGEWFVGLEFGSIVCRNLTPGDTGLSSTAASLVGTVGYSSNFIARMIQTIKSTNYSSSLVWEIDNSNRIFARIYKGTLNLYTTVAGTNNITTTTPLTCAIGDIVEFVLKRNGTTVTLVVFKNNNYNSPTILSKEVSFSSVGYLSVGHAGNMYSNIQHLAITTTEYATKAGEAEVAKALAIKYKATSFSVNELSFGQLGIDTGDTRIYIKVGAATLGYWSYT